MNGLFSLKPQIKRNLIFLFTSGLLFWTGITIMLPVLPAYIQDIGATTQQVGLVMGCFAIGLLCSRTWLGQIADRQGRKIVLLIGTLVAAIAPLGYVFIHSIGGLAGIRAFHGISIAAFTIGYSALVVDYAPREYRGTLIGYMNLAVPIGMGVGPALGGYLVSSTNYQTIFVISASCGFVALVLSSQLREYLGDNFEIDKESLDRPVRSFRDLIGDSALVIPGIVLFLIGLVYGSLIAFLPLYVRELDLAFNVGLFYTVVAIASFTIRIFIGRISDNHGRGILITCSIVFYLVSMIMLAKADSAEALLLTGIVQGSGAGILLPTVVALISDRSYHNERGKVFALCLGGFDVGMALAGPVLGFFETYISYRGVYSIAAVLATVALVVFLTRCNKDVAHSLGFALGREKDAFALD